MDILLLALRILLAITLYAFLAAVVLMLWRDLRQETAERDVVRRSGQLVIAETPNQALAGTTFPLQPITSIGRSPGNTIPIADTYASAEHALLTWRAGQWWLEDRDSRNGTSLNNVRIDEPTIVSAGDTILIGRTKLKLELD